MSTIDNFSSTIWYYCHQYWVDIADPRTRDYPLCGGGPELLIVILIAYLLFVKRIGPALMKNRDPFILRVPMMVYNSLMVIVNIYFFYEITGRSDYGRRFLNFKFPDRSDYSPDTLREIHVGYWCYISRFMDLLDTIFFVLRKKYNQITFLHLYHHTLVPIMGWLCLKIAVQAPVVGLFLIFNTLIHSIMYLYYALSAFGPAVRRYLWWKKYITQLQLLQFATCFCYGVAMVFLQQGFPPGLFWLGFAQNPFFFYMFYQFYQKAYHTQKSKSHVKNNQQSNNQQSNNQQSNGQHYNSEANSLRKESLVKRQKCQ